MKNKTLLIFLLILVLNLVPHIYVSFSKPDTLLNWYLTDDAFYYFKTAQNIAEGAGITFDGIAPTNGFHPLWMIVCVPVFALARFDLFLPLRILIILQGVLNAVSGYLLYRLFADHISEEVGWVAAAFWMFFPAIHGITTKLGLESGINALSILFLFFCLSRLSENAEDQGLQLKQYLGISLAAVLCLLSRLDNIFIVLMVGVWIVFRSSSLRRTLLFDFSLIILVVVISYYSRIQTTDNIFNFLPFFFLLTAFSLVIKPIAFYFLKLYDVDQMKDLKQILFRSVAAVTISSLLIGLVFYIVHDLMHVFRGFSRSVLIIDWLLALLIFVPIRIFWFIRCQRYGCDEEDVTLKTNWRSWLRAASVYFLPLFAILSGYMVINKTYAGSAMPVSGQIKRWWGTLPNTVYGRPISNLQGVISGFLDTDVETGPFWLITKPVNSIAFWLSRAFQLVKSSTSVAHPYLLALVWIVLFAILISILIGSWQIFAHQSDRLGLATLASGCFIHIISYKTTGYLHAKYWYWVSELILLVLICGLILGSALKNWYGKKSGHTFIRGFSFLAVILLFAGFVNSIFRDFPIKRSAVRQYDYVGEKTFIESQTNPGDVIGMTGGGLVGYFIPDRKIVNLDGLINSAEYFEKLKSDQANNYLEDIGVKYIYGEEPVLLDSDPYRWIFTDHIRFKAKGPFFSIYDYCVEKCQ
jgi:hypothetical protein